MTQTRTTLPAQVEEARKTFELACQDAQALQVVNNFGAAFQAVSVVTLLRQALTDEVMDQVFMPLMNTKIGFLTDHNGRPNSRGVVKPPYSKSVVRDCIIDAVTIGLLPTGNQFNIIADRMYPTKEGYTALLRKIGVKYLIEVGADTNATQGFATIPCRISFEHSGEKKSFVINATVKKDDYSSPDQLRGKAERRAKKALYEYITGCDYGDADETSSEPTKPSTAPVQDAVAEEINENANQGPTIGVQPQAQQAPTQAAPQPAAQPAQATVQPEAPKAKPAQPREQNVPGF